MIVIKLLPNGNFEQKIQGRCLSRTNDQLVDI